MTTPKMRRILSGGGGIRWLLRDEFTTALGAGSVNGTAAEPGPGTRTVTDTGSKLSLSGGLAVWNGTQSAGDPRVMYGAVTRGVGIVLISRHNTDGGVSRGRQSAGFSSSANTMDAGWYDTGSGFRPKANNAAVGVNFYTPGATPEVCYFATVLRSQGAYFFGNWAVGTSGIWKLQWMGPAGTAATLYPYLTTRTDGNGPVDFIRMPEELWLPTSLAYDTFARADGALGSTLITGPDGQPCTARTWTGATWAISSEKAVNTPVAGDEAVTNGAFTAWTGDDPDNWTVSGEDANNYVTEDAGKARMVSDNSASLLMRQTCGTSGMWYAGSVDVTAAASGSVGLQRAAGTSFLILNAVQNYAWTWRHAADSWRMIRGGACDITIDNFSLKPITWTQLFSSVQVSTADVLVDVATTCGLYHACGVVVNLDSAANPQNFIMAYIHRSSTTYAYLDEYVAGTLTNKIAATVTYAAGAQLRVIRDGTSCSVFYNGTQVGTLQSMSANTNTLHGLFSTSPLNSLDNFAIYPRGNGGEYIALDKWSAS